MKVHWVPGVPVSWPSGGKRNPNMRTFLLAGWPVCNADPHTSEGTADRDLVTCGTCKRRMSVARLDSEAVVKEVLSRGPETGGEGEGDRG